MTKKVSIILGGTFDPVHFGHLRMAQEMVNQFPQAEIALMPAAYPPHRDEPAASAEQRVEMLQLVFDEIPSLNSQISIDSRELERNEPSYSVVTLKEIRQEIADNCLIFLMGTDAFVKLDSWYQWQNLLDLTNILVIGRPSSDLPTTGPVAELYQKHQVKTPQELAQYSAGKVAFYQMPQLDISSTYIRAQIKCGKSPRFLLPSVILDFIQSQQLYSQQKGKNAT